MANRGKRLDRYRYWSKKLEQWKSSGKSQASFCREDGICARHFSLWKRKLNQTEGNASNRIVEVALNSKQAMQDSHTPVVQVVLANRVKVRIDGNLDFQKTEMILRLAHSL